MPNPIRVPITQPRVPFLNPETGFVSMPWYLFLLSLSELTGGSDVSLGDLQKGPPTLTVDEINAIIDKAAGDITPSQDGLLAQIAELQKQVQAQDLYDCCNSLVSQVTELQKQVQAQDLYDCCNSLVSQVTELQKQVGALSLLPAQVTAMLSQLADVSAMNPSDGDKLIYDATLGKWKQDSRSYLMLE